MNTENWIDHILKYNLKTTQRNVIKFGWDSSKPWIYLDPSAAISMYLDYQIKFPNMNLLPFARRLDNDDYACLVGGYGKVQIIHEHCEPSWAIRKLYKDFKSWLEEAENENINWDK